MSTQPKTFLTPEQYLEIERKAEYRSEYYQGEMFAMAGATENHNLIITNAVVALSPQLRPRDCRVYEIDVRVRVSPTGLYTYPDLVVVCGQRQFLDDTRDTLLNPTLIVEVLSHSTEAYDRGTKFAQYRTVESVREYLMLSTDRVEAELYARRPDEKWLLTSATGRDGVLELESVCCTLALADLYRDVELA